MAVAGFNFPAPVFAAFSSGAVLTLSFPFPASPFAFVSLPLGGMASCCKACCTWRKNTNNCGACTILCPTQSPWATTHVRTVQTVRIPFDTYTARKRDIKPSMTSLSVQCVVAPTSKRLRFGSESCVTHFIRRTLTNETWSISSAGVGISL